MSNHVAVKIHPLVVSAACDHFTRLRLGGSKLPTSAPVVGLLFGTFDEITYSVCDNTDVVLEIINEDYRILDADIERRRRLWTTVYQHYKLIGWYSFGSEVLPMHSGFHKSICSFAPDPIFLLFDSEPNKADFDKIPIQTFKAASIDGNDNIPLVFSSLSFKIDSPEVEKIAIDEIIQSVPHGYGSSLESFNSTASVSLTALDSKLSKIIGHLSKMQSGLVEWNADFARNAAAIVQSLERMNSAGNQSKINEEVTDSMMNLFLGSATKSLATVQDLQSLYTVLYNFDREATRK